jgi:hypothetical protein
MATKRRGSSKKFGIKKILATVEFLSNDYLDITSWIPQLQNGLKQS